MLLKSDVNSKYKKKGSPTTLYELRRASKKSKNYKKGGKSKVICVHVYKRSKTKYQSHVN